MDKTDVPAGLELLLELQAIYDLKARRDHAVDRKVWETYAALHTADYVAMSITPEPIVGGRAAARQLAVQMANVTGVWAMQDNLFWTRNGKKQWLRGFGFYHETYVKGDDGKWRFRYRKLERTHAETSPGASILAADASGETEIIGVG